MRQPLRRSRLARLLAHAGVVLGAGWLAACSSVSPGTTAQNTHGAQLRHGEPVFVTESDAVRQLNAASQAQGDDGEVIVSNDLCTTSSRKSSAGACPPNWHCFPSWKAQ